MRTLFVLALALLSGCTCGTVRQLKEPSSLTADGKAVKTRSDNALDYSVAISIGAKPETVWAVLTDASGFTKWNSTLNKLDGKIEKDGKVELVSKVAPDRTFTLKVSEFDAPKKMVWEDGNAMFLGVRHFTLTEKDGATVLAMSETYSGMFLGSAEKEMPDFTTNFETFAADVKREAESRNPKPAEPPQPPG
jgi:uncharacterized protein YndB with AHSA1/START domain